MTVPSGIGIVDSHCHIAGGEFAGVAHDSEIRLQRTDIMRCPVNMDGGPGMPFTEFERTVTLALERW